MRIISITKRWMFISMLFLGISLTVYAAATKVKISNIAVDEITSTTAELTVMCSGANQLNFFAKSSEDEEFYLIESISVGIIHYEVYFLENLNPETTYSIIIEAVSAPDPDDPDNVTRAQSEINFRTLPADPEP